MDNGLIFPYPYKRAHGESVILTVQKLLLPFFEVVVVDARDLIW